MIDHLDAIRARAEAATPGPWSMWNPAEGPSHLTIGGKVAWESKRSASEFSDTERIPHWSDATFIANAREDIPALIAEVERLRSELAKSDHAFSCLKDQHAAADVELLNLKAQIAQATS